MTKKKTKDGAPNLFSDLTHEPVLKAASRMVSVKTPDGIQKISAVELNYRQLEKTANNGSPHAQRHLFELVKEAELAKQHQIAGNVELARTWKANLEKERSAAVARGEDPESVLPCPDDILINPSRGYSIYGPTNVEELKKTKQTIAFRDALIMQEALEERLAKTSKHENSSFGTPMLLALLLNDALPARFRSEQHKIMCTFDRWSRMTKRELLKHCFQSWQNLHVHLPRGYVFPETEKIAHTLIIMQRAAAHVFAGAEKGNMLSKRQIEEVVLQVDEEVRR